MFTFEKGTDFPPACYTSLTGVLPDSCLHEKQRDATGKQEEDIGDEKHA